MIKKTFIKTIITFTTAIALTLNSSAIASFSSLETNVYAATSTARQMEYLDRGVIATKVNNGVYIGWRMLGTDSENISFNIYRDGKKINSSPITNSTNYLDTTGTTNSKYSIKPVINNKEQDGTSEVSVSSTPYKSIPIKKPADGKTPSGEEYSYSANDGSVGDVDGDGQYEIILKWDPSNSKDNSQDGYTGNTYIDAYKMDGTFLWRIDLGVNIRSGAHYTQFIVYDFDGDGKAEIACKTADGTKDGTGKYIGDKSKDYRDSKGRVLSGPEYLTMFEGSTGKALSTIDFSPERGKVSDWGDKYGNRVDRFLGGVAYLDGKTPSLVMSRGYYAKTAITTYNFKDGKLTENWEFVADSSQNSDYRDRGCHSLSIADVDDDGKDEIIFGSATIDDNGKGLYSTGLSHGDALHVGDLDPNNDGLEVFQVHESKTSKYGFDLRDAKTGKVLWGVKTGTDVGRGLTADIDPTHPGEEMWASGQGLYNSSGKKISSSTPGSINFAAWWDGDLSRELVDRNRIDKWDYKNNKLNRLLTATGCSANNSTKATPVLQADILGDWREEIIWRTDDSSELRIYSTTDITEYRIHTLMHDYVYRLGVAWQNVAYNQPPHTSFFLGNGMSKVSQPNIYLAGNSNSSNDSSSSSNNSTSNNSTTVTKITSGKCYRLKNANSGQYMDVKNGNYANNTNIQQHPSNDESAQVFKIVSVGDGYYKMVSQVGNANKVVDVSGKKTANGTNIALYTDKDATNQQFKFKRLDNGNFVIYTKISKNKSVIEVKDASKSKKANIQQWEYNSHLCQQWILELAE